MIGIHFTSSLEVDGKLVAEAKSHLGGLVFSYHSWDGKKGLTFSCRKANQRVLDSLRAYLKEEPAA